MSDTPRVTALKDGPLKVENVPNLTMSDGSAGEAKAAMFLCRCGHSANKPFCDGSHKREGWAE
ncbi:MAG: CDGSH iron-sulfur domain-containing protein [Rhodobacterales bacterium]|nr:CDGSH iron-sulfur domain-containing protein [Pseudomonadota bacterium]NQW15750.1 CDGSH iron-sulfur domain-containing protein [Rhodobacter sp.]